MKNFEQAIRLINKGDFLASVVLRLLIILFRLQMNNNDFYVSHGRVSYINLPAYQMAFQRVLSIVFSLN